MTAIDLSAYNDDNIFARILRGEIPSAPVYEDDFALAFKDINPQAAVHVLVIPKGRFMSMADFSASAPADLVTGFFRAVGKTADSLGLVEGGYRIIANHGPDSHQEVPHFHVHILAGQAVGPLIDRSVAGPDRA